MRCCRVAVRGCEGGGMSQRELPGIVVVWAGFEVGDRMVGDGAGMVERASAEQNDVRRGSGPGVHVHVGE